MYVLYVLHPIEHTLMLDIDPALVTSEDVCYKVWRLSAHDKELVGWVMRGIGGYWGYWGVAWGCRASDEVSRSTRITRGGDVGSQEGLK